MVLGEVIGSIWGDKQVLGMAGLKLVVVRPLDTPDVHLVAADRIGAGEGEIVLVANGTRVRDLVYDERTPVKTVVVGIVDDFRVDGLEAP